MSSAYTTSAPRASGELRACHDLALIGVETMPDCPARFLALTSEWVKRGPDAKFLRHSV